MSVILGDSLDKLKNINDNSIDLIYLDPPFFTQKTQKSKNKDNTKDNIVEWEGSIDKRRNLTTGGIKSDWKSLRK